MTLRVEPIKDDDRGRERVRRAGLTGVVTLVARALTVVLNLATLPLTSRYLGQERYGLWLTLSSFIGWMVIVDFGLGNSLINALARANGRDDRDAARGAVASAFWIITAVATAFGTLCLMIVPVVSWGRVFNVSTPQAQGEVAPALLVVLIFCALRLPAAVVGCIYQAYQEGYAYQLCSIAGGLLGAMGLVLAIQAQAGLPWLTGAFLGGLLMTDLIAAIYLFGWRRAWLRPAPRYFHLAEARALLRHGALFWVAQVSAVLMLQMDLLIVARLFGASTVAGYGTGLRLFALIGAVQTAFIAPYWAAYGEAAARGDGAWLRRTFARSIKLSLFWSVPAALALCLAMPWVLQLLVTPDVTVGWHLRLAVMTTEVVNSVARCVSVLLNGLGAIRLQAVLGPVGGAVNLLLSWLLAQQLGAPGVAWATTICLLLFWVMAMGNEARRCVRRMSGEVAYAGC